MSNFNEFHECIVSLVRRRLGHVKLFGEYRVQSPCMSYQATSSILVSLGTLDELSYLHFLIIHLVALTSTGDVDWCEQEDTARQADTRCAKCPSTTSPPEPSKLQKGKHIPICNNTRHYVTFPRMFSMCTYARHPGLLSCTLAL